MKKLLLVMLVPVLVLGLFSCGKLLDADLVPFELQGTWKTSAANGVVMVISGNQATLYENATALPSLEPAAFRIEVTGSQDETTKSIPDGKIKFVGFKDKKTKEIATVEFVYTHNAANPITNSTLELFNLKRTDDSVSVLLPATNPDGTTKTSYLRLKS
jgi:hypothetical protein